jgi:hypothetical protein
MHVWPAHLHASPLHVHCHGNRVAVLPASRGPSCYLLCWKTGRQEFSVGRHFIFCVNIHVQQAKLRFTCGYKALCISVFLLNIVTDVHSFHTLVMSNGFLDMSYKYTISSLPCCLVYFVLIPSFPSTHLPKCVAVL